MENKFGMDVKVFRNVIVRNSFIDDNSIIADDVFITDSSMGRNCTIERRGMIFNSEIGDFSYTGYNTVVKYSKIGKFCSISWNVSIGGANHDYTHLTTHPFAFNKKYGFIDKTNVYTEKSGGGYSSFEKESVLLGNDVWVAAGVNITRGVSIGDGAVIGAGAVVTKDIPPYEIWAGIPAKKIGQRFSDTTIKELKNLPWWELPYEVLRDNIDLFQKDFETKENLDRLKSLFK